MHVAVAMMRIHVLVGNKTLTLDIDPKDDVATLIALLKRMDRVIPPNSDFTLYFAGRKIETRHTLEYYWIQQDSRVILDLNSEEKAGEYPATSHTCACS